MPFHFFPFVINNYWIFSRVFGLILWFSHHSTSSYFGPVLHETFGSPSVPFICVINHHPL